MGAEPRNAKCYASSQSVLGSVPRSQKTTGICPVHPRAYIPRPDSPDIKNGIAQNEEERAEVIKEAKEILDVEDVIASIFLVEDLRVVKK